MAKLLEQYQQERAAFAARFKTVQPLISDVWKYQEIEYRISVLESFAAISKAAPVGTDMKALSGHYQVVDAFIQQLTQERQFKVNGEVKQKQFETAGISFAQVVGDYRKRFSSFAPSGPEHYKTEIGKVICAVLTVWIAFRNTIIEL